MKEQILEFTQKIRSVLSNEFIINDIYKDKEKYNKIFASGDIIEDAEYAIDSYKIIDFKNNELGEKYLSIYGLFEAFYLQEQAIKNMLIELGIDIQRFPNEIKALNEIKEIRNDIAGHPSFRNQKNYSVYLAQCTITKELIDYQKSDTGELIKVDLMALIINQEDAIFNLLKQIYAALKQEELEHYKKFKDEKLYDIFYQRYSYPREKIHRRSFFYEALRMLKDLINNTKDMLNKRFVDYKELNYFYIINDIDDVLLFLEEKIENLNINSRYIHFIQKNMIENLINKFDYLGEILREIDEKYEDYFKPEKKIIFKEQPVVIIENCAEEKI